MDLLDPAKPSGREWKRDACGVVLGSGPALSLSSTTTDGARARPSPSPAAHVPPMSVRVAWRRRGPRIPCVMRRTGVVWERFGSIPCLGPARRRRPPPTRGRGRGRGTPCADVRAQAGGRPYGLRSNALGLAGVGTPVLTSPLLLAAAVCDSSHVSTRVILMGQGIGSRGVGWLLLLVAASQPATAMCSAHAHVNCQEPCCRAVQGSIGTSATAVHHLRSSRSRDYCREQSYYCSIAWRRTI